MQRYLVGGAVRDAMLGLPVRERDWVVTGATPETMIEAGYRPVGKDFPVFLHPQTQEEHALARTERKTARGYHGFSFNTSTEVTIEQDLSRRDLTVNAMAQTDDGQIIDPYGGQNDLRARVLRHVSPAFAEDPVRILRVARFAARFSPMGFTLAPETLALMRSMAGNGEVDHLVPERVWKETERALTGDNRPISDDYRPSVFFRVLRDCDALARVMPEVDALFGIPQPERYHPEIDTGEHVMMCVDAAHRMGFSPAVRAAALLHDLGKALTPRWQWPGHKLHDVRGVALVETFCERLRLPRTYRELAVVVTRQHINVHGAMQRRPNTLLELLESLRAFRGAEFFENALHACLCDARGRAGLENCDYPPVPYLREAARVAAQVSVRELDTKGLNGAQIGEALRKARIERLRQWKNNR